MKYTYSELERQIVMEVRIRALRVKRFMETKQGCIRISAYPECQEAHEWLGGTGDFDPDDVCDFEHVYPILPGGSRTAKFENPDGTVEIVDTYAVTAMKIAQLSSVQDAGNLLSVTGEARSAARLHSGSLLTARRSKRPTAVFTFPYRAHPRKRINLLQWRHRSWLKTASVMVARTSRFICPSISSNDL